MLEGWLDLRYSVRKRPVAAALPRVHWMGSVPRSGSVCGCEHTSFSSPLMTGLLPSLKREYR